MNVKPLLFNDLVIGKKFHIQSRIHYSNNFEIYHLKDLKYLLIFFRFNEFLKDTTPGIKLFNYNGQYYQYKTYEKTYSKTKILREVDDILNPKGINSIAGMANLKSIFLNDIIEPLRNKEKYEKFQISLPNAVLLFGPPGCGKTYFVKKIAEDIGYHLILTSQSSFGSTYIHGTSLKIKEIFDEARLKAPSIIFIDEIDSLFPKRLNLDSSQTHKQEEINEFLVQMNQANKQGILILAATNRPDLLDEALLRTGRIDKLIYIDLPDFESRISLFKFYLRNRPCKDIDYKELAIRTNQYTSSDIEYLSNEAAKSALVRNSASINMIDFNSILIKSKPSVSSDMILSYEKFKSMARE